MKVRRAVPGDAAELVALRTALWPEAPEDHPPEVDAILAGKPRSTLPLVVFVAESNTGALVGFVEVGLRSHADGCDTSRPVGFVEGWYVLPEHQRHGVGRALIEAAEEWSREHGCTEIASDTWIDNEPSQRAHAALGFEVVDRCVNYRKSLALGRQDSFRSR